MTKDKQIIINGCDVSGCESFCNGICCKVGFGDDASCKLFSNCNHKQLKRAEKTMQEIWDRLGKVSDELQAKEKECEELKEEVQQALKKNAENYNNSCSLQKEVNQLKEELSQKYVKDDIKTYCPFFFRDTATCLGRDLNEIGQLNFCRKYHNCWIKKIAKENSQLKQQLEAYKMEAEEGKEINAELKAENVELKDKLNCCFCNPYVELNDIEKQRKCIEVTECFRRQLDQLKAENEELKKIIERLDVPKHEVIDMDIALENEKLKTELQRYKDMEAKGLEEFKDVGGCWGCGIQSSLDQMAKDYTELKAENEELKKEINNKYSVSNFNVIFMREHIHNLKQTLIEIKEIAELKQKQSVFVGETVFEQILQKISEVE